MNQTILNKTKKKTKKCSKKIRRISNQIKRKTSAQVFFGGDTRLLFESKNRKREIFEIKK